MFGTETIDLSFSFSPWVWGIALVLAGIFTYLAYRITNPPLSKGKKTLLGVLRFIAFVAIFLMILEPVLVWINSKEIQPQLAILWDNSLSMSLEDRSGSRKAMIDELIESKALDQIRDEYPHIEMAFTDSLYEIEDSLTLDGGVTAIGSAIEYAEAMFDENNPLGSAIIISDGQTNFGPDPLNTSYRADFRIFTIGVGDPTPPQDIALKQLVVQKVAYVGQDFPVITGVSSWGYKDTETSIAIYSGGEKIDEKQISLGEKGEFTDVTFSVVPETTGIITYRIVTPELPGELTSDNNSRSIRVKVLPSKRKILVASSKPTWEMTFFLRAIRSNPDYLVETAYIGKMATAGDTRLPTSISELKKYDAVTIIGGLKKIANSGFSSIIDEYIRSGHSLFIYLLEDQNLQGSLGEIWGDLYPFVYSSGSHVWTEDEFNPELTVKGLVHPVTRISEATISPDEAYAKLPPLTGMVMATGSQTGAEVLMVHPRLPDVPIVAVAERNKGRVLMLNGSGFWRWSFVPFGFGGDNQVYESLVSNGMSWLLAAGDTEPFTVELDKRVYRSGERIFISATLKDESNQRLSGARIEALITNTSVDSIGDSINVVLEERESGIYTFELPSMAVGKWNITATAVLEEQQIGKASTKFMVEPYSLELENVRLNENTLKSIAEVTDGAYFQFSEIDSLPEALDIKPVLRRVRSEKEIWDSLILLIIFLLALSTEWILRKKWDLP